jgi:HAD superfamily phosphoserine phosphatase-like hydrolase
MQRIAIYDLDRTLLRKPTFTPFLMFAARKLAPWRLLWLPIWIAAMIGYRMGLYGRKPLKQFGIRLFVGAEIAPHVARDFAAHIVPKTIQPGAAAAMERDRADGRMLVIATAAPDFYASEIARITGFDAVIATRHMITGGGRASYLIDGENCYGEEKLRRIASWLENLPMDRLQCDIRFYTDHQSDAPVLNWADCGIFVGASDWHQQTAAAKGWQYADFNKVDLTR